MQFNAIKSLRTPAQEQRLLRTVSQVFNSLFASLFVSLFRIVACVVLIGNAQAIFASEDNPYAAELIAKAKSLKIAESTAWQNLLYYQPKTYISKRGMLDSPGFYLAANGKTDSSAELEATIRAYFWPKKGDNSENIHPICAYPARLQLLTAKLNIDSTRLPQVDCKDLKDFLVKLNIERVSLVFSSYYLNNPASLYGHTFLRLHRRGSGSGQKAAMLDMAVNVAAQLDSANVNPFAYAWNGLFGGYPGMFSISPYYLKVQEYNNSESRDLWEYELRLNDDEIRTMFYVLWEIGPYHMDYYYFDDNCSYAILAMLQAVKPEWPLLDSLKHAWIIPADTVRTVREVGAMADRVDYRPSSYMRYVSRVKHLDANELNLMRLVLESKDTDSIKKTLDSTAVHRRALILDAALEFIDFDEKIAATKESVRYAQARRAILITRSTLTDAPESFGERPERDRTDLGRGSTRHGLELGRNDLAGNFAQFEWRPALHDMVAREEGYSKFLQLKFFATWLRFEPEHKALYLKRWDLIELLSIAPTVPMISPKSINLVFGLEQVDFCEAVPHCYRVRLAGGMGKGLSAFNEVLILYAIPQLDAGIANDRNFALHGGPGLLLGGVLKFSQNVRLSLQTTGKRFFSSGPTKLLNVGEAEAVLSYAPSNTVDLRVRTLMTTEKREAGISAGYYW